MQVIVKYVRQDEVNDIFKVVYIGNTFEDSGIKYKTYPRSMGMTEEEVLNGVE